jgi:hypothetical protein
MLAFDILPDDIVSHIPAATTEIPTSPKMPTPVLSPQMLKLSQHLIRGLALQSLHQPADGYLRWKRYEKVNVIPGDMPFYDLDVFPSADLTDQIPYPKGHVSLQDGFTIFGDPHQMQVDHENAMCSVPIFRHTGKISKNC